MDTATSNSPPVRLASYKTLAQMSGLSVRTVTSYGSIGRLPAPDFVVDNKPLWLYETAVAWNANRPRKSVLPDVAAA